MKRPGSIQLGWKMAAALALLCLFDWAVPLASAEEQTRKIYRDKVEANWFAGNSRFWYRLDLPGGRREFIMVDAEKGVRAPAFDHQRVAKALSDKLEKPVDPERLPFDRLRYSDDQKSITLVGEQTWKFDIEQYLPAEEKLEEDRKTEEPPEEVRRRRSGRGRGARSPDEKWEVVVRGDNLFVKELSSGKERRFTHDGNPGHSYARSAQRARLVEMRYNERDEEQPEPEVYWAPDSSRFVAMRVRPGTDRTVYMVASSPDDQLQPKLESYPYAKPGDEIPIRKPHLFELESGREIKIEDALFSNPWSIGDLRWAKDSSRFTFLYNQRGHQVLRVVAVDATSGESRPIVDEVAETFVNYSGKFFCDYLDESDEIVWMSERDGWNHLYLFDSRTGSLKNQITRGEWVVRRVERVDRDARQVWFQASGIRAGEDPYYIHHCRVDFDGSNLVILTEGDGTHSVDFSPDRKYLIDTWSRVDHPPQITLRRVSDGSLVCELEKADATELFESGWKSPERFVAKGRDGETDIYGIIHWPAEFNPETKYPVIESIYAGPHDSFVPKSFRTSYGQDKLTRRGFIVVQIDGMGTSNRSKKFHDVCWKNIADAGFPDRKLWIQAAAKQFPAFDLARVGIYGTSAGAQSALGALLFHGDFYHAAVSDCGCHDNRMDKIWWNEQWMGWPVGPHYEEQSNVTQARRLQGKLLLMVGELDRNVDPASTMQVVNALIKADKDFEMLVIPGGGHGMARTSYGWRRLEEFFVRHLQPNRNSVEQLSTAAR